MKSLLCCIAKCENLYLRDFVEYYKRIGFDNIVLFDNNDSNGEYPHQVIGDYIADGFVIYKNCRGEYRYQLKAYEACYNEYKSQYDWIAFFDVDEFLYIDDGETVNNFLGSKKFENANSVIIYWVDYGDNGLLHYDSRPVYERFTSEAPKNGEINVFKVILRCFPDAYITFNDVNSIFLTSNSAFAYNCFKANGEQVSENAFYDSCYDCAVLKHYHTLTIEEFLYRRFGRGSTADTLTPFTKKRVMQVFTDVNEVTSEKQKIIDDFFDKFTVIENNIDPGDL